ncbi:hypothetical protein ACFLY9_02820 [Patescibacteria group bacterium]
MQNCVKIPWGNLLANRKIAIESLIRIRGKISDHLKNGPKLTGQYAIHNDPIQTHLGAMLEILNSTPFISTDEPD